MNKQAKTYIALLLVIGVLAVAKLKLGKKPEESAVFRFPASEVAKVHIQAAGEQPLELQRQGKEWYITQPVRALAIVEDADRIASALADLKLRSDYREERETGGGERGLDKPTLVVQAWNAKGKQLAEVKLGDETRTGGERWALVDGKLCTLSSYIKTDFEKDANGLRDKKLARFEKDDVRQLELKYGTTDIVCVKEPKADAPETDTWDITKPVRTGADDFQVDTVVEAIKNLETLGFVESKDKGLKDFGLDKPSTVATLTFKKKAKLESVTLWFGSQTSKGQALGSSGAGGEADEQVFYAKRMGREEILCVPLKKVSELQVGLKSLRDRTIWQVDTDFVQRVTVKRPGGNIFTLARTDKDEWQVIDPKPAKVDESKMDSLLWGFEDLRAEDFVDDAPQDLARYGLDKPRAEVRLTMSKGKDKVLLVGRNRAAQVYVKTADSPSVYTVRESVVEKLPAVLSDIAKAEAPKREERVPSAEAPASREPSAPPPGSGGGN